MSIFSTFAQRCPYSQMDQLIFMLTLKVSKLFHIKKITYLTPFSQLHFCSSVFSMRLSSSIAAFICGFPLVVLSASGHQVRPRIQM